MLRSKRHERSLSLVRRASRFSVLHRHGQPRAPTMMLRIPTSLVLNTPSLAGAWPVVIYFRRVKQSTAAETAVLTILVCSARLAFRLRSTQEMITMSSLASRPQAVDAAIVATRKHGSRTSAVVTTPKHIQQTLPRAQIWNSSPNRKTATKPLLPVLN